jgi:hypothetical protein
MNRAELYLERSQSYAASAAMTDNPTLRATLLHLSQKYTELAYVAQRNVTLQANNDSVADPPSIGDR